MRIALDLPEGVVEEADILDLMVFASLIVSKKFEGHTMEWTFTEETWAALQLLIAIHNGEAITGENLKVWISSLLSDPVSVLMYKAD